MADGAEEIVLTTAADPGDAGSVRAVLPMHRAGAVRCDLGTRQYNVDEAAGTR